ncbi:MAG: NAD-dependent epimerase/dehydratase family protein [Actinobacteria bacterium]|nr:NAD-dependent epimerase/dehydratase family protein [Actinomycetota bacterium]
MRVAITGGSGVVGAAVLRHLVAAAHEVRALARSDAAAAGLAALGAVPVHGDLLDRSALGALVEGCERVFHVAGVNELCPRDPGLMWRVNVEGTRMVVEACSEAAVPRLVHTSSAVTVGQRSGEMGHEETDHRGWYLSEYERSKVGAEMVALAAPASLEVVAVNPSSVQGPGRATGTGRILLAAARGRLPVAIDTTISFVDVDDCARGHLLAAERGKPGQRYLLSGATLSTGEALGLLTSLTGRTSRVRMIPPEALAVAAWLVEAVFSLAGRRPPLCREMARVMRFGHRYDGSKAAVELGLEYTPVANTLGRTVRWFEEEGLLQPEKGTKIV